MCDYSLFEFPNRLAVKGEILVTHRFHGGTVGLVEQGKPTGFSWDNLRNKVTAPCAVCVPPGSRVSFVGGPVSTFFGINEPQGVFEQCGIDAGRHRDGIRTDSGRFYLLGELGVGNQIRILSVEAVEQPAAAVLPEHAAEPVAVAHG